MKRFVYAFLLFFVSISIHAQEINWMSLEEALAKQKKMPKPIFMDVYTDWCGPCKLMDKGTYQDQAVVDYINKNYYAVKFNGEGNSKVSFQGASFSNPNFDPNRKGRNSAHELTKYLKVPGYPAMYVIDTKGNIKETIEGAKEPSELIRLLKN